MIVGDAGQAVFTPTVVSEPDRAKSSSTRPPLRCSLRGRFPIAARSDTAPDFFQGATPSRHSSKRSFSVFIVVVLLDGGAFLVCFFIGTPDRSKEKLRRPELWKARDQRGKGAFAPIQEPRKSARPHSFLPLRCCCLRRQHLCQPCRGPSGGGRRDELVLAVRIAVIEVRLHRLHVAYKQPRPVGMLRPQKICGGALEHRIACRILFHRARTAEHVEGLSGRVCVARGGAFQSLGPTAVFALGGQNLGAYGTLRLVVAAEHVQAPQSPEPILLRFQRHALQPPLRCCSGLGELRLLVRAASALGRSTRARYRRPARLASALGDMRRANARR